MSGQALVLIETVSQELIIHQSNLPKESIVGPWFDLAKNTNSYQIIQINNLLIQTNIIHITYEHIKKSEKTSKFRKKIIGRKKWNESFSSKEFVYGTEPNVFIKDQAKRFKSKSKIACLAEGEDRNAVHLAKLSHEVTAYDVSERGLDKAKTLAEINQVSIKTKQINLIDENLSHETYDNAVLVFGHVHKDNQEKLINNMIQTVKKDGLIMLEIYSTEQINFETGGPGNLDYLYDPQTMLELIKPYEVLHFYYGQTEHFEDLRHSGTGHVIQVIIRK